MAGRVSPFDAVLLIAFGGPNGPADVMPFLENVVRGRRVPAGAAARGRRALRDLRRRLPDHRADARQARAPRSDDCASDGLPLPGARRHAQLAPVPRRHAADDVGGRRPPRDRVHRRAAPQLLELRAVSRERSATRAAQLRRAGLADVDVIYVDDWHAHPGYVAACAAAGASTRSPRCRADVRGRRSWCSRRTASPRRRRSATRIGEQFEETARLVRDAVERVEGTRRSRACVYQSRSGRPEDPWLGPTSATT